MYGHRHAISLALVAALSSGVVGAQVLTSINIDGNMADWSVVLADPFQRADDGPPGGLPDLDAPVQSTGRDLITFAWTYDTSYLYFYVARDGNSSNIQRFWYYIDTDADGAMETGEPVVAVAWKAAQRRTDISLYSYNAVSPAGDPLGDSSGSADGWDMPGTVSLIADIESLRGGSADGLSMENRISWTNLGVAPGTPLRFHVASSNSANLPAQLDDNMGGPGGSIGSTLLGGVLITPDGSGTTVPGGFAVVLHTVTNGAQTDDRVNLDWSASGDFVPVGTSFYGDADGDGALGPGDPLLTDTDGDGLPNTGWIAGGASISILAVPTAPAGVLDGDSSTIVLTASSSGSPFFSDAATDLITVATPNLTLVKAVDVTDALPGQTVTYTVVYTSVGSVDAYQVVVVDPVPAPAVYVPGSAQGAGTTVEFSHDGGGTYDSSETAPVTHIRWTLATSLAPGTGGSVSFQAVIP